jgi:phosphoketolase
MVRVSVMKMNESGEESFLVFGIDQEEAIRLGKAFGQNAIVWIT